MRASRDWRPGNKVVVLHRPGQRSRWNRRPVICASEVQISARHVEATIDRPPRARRAAQAIVDTQRERPDRPRPRPYFRALTDAWCPILNLPEGYPKR